MLLGAVTDRDNRFAALLNEVHRSGPHLALDRIDPYGYVVMSTAELEQLSKELSALAERAQRDADRELIERIELLVSRCLAEGDAHHVHFVGD